jgi:signal transduction histidine kinase
MPADPTATERENGPVSRPAEDERPTVTTVGQPHLFTSIRGWHAVFWIMMGLVVLWLVLTTTLSPRDRLLALVIGAVIAVSYVVLLQRPERDVGWRAIIYLSIAIVATGLECAISPTLTMLLFLVYSQIWMFTPYLRAGIGFATALAVCAFLGLLWRDGFSWHSVREDGVAIAVSLAFSMVIGVWITKIIDQSMERAELIQALEAARAQLGVADHARGVMAERERMAREIHDTLAQGFTSIVMLAQAASAGIAKHPERAAERLSAIEDVARENLAEARSLVAAFGPVGLEGSTLPDAVRRLTERFAAQTGLELELDVDQTASGLSRDQEVVLLRAVQESLTNVRRHAAARRVVVRLHVDPEGAWAQVGDDGVGFATGAAQDGGFGLAGMRGRLTEVGGELDVASAPGLGTRVTVRVPIRAGGLAGQEGA